MFRDISKLAELILGFWPKPEILKKEVGKISKLTLGLFRWYQYKMTFSIILLKTSEEIASFLKEKWSALQDF